MMERFRRIEVNTNCQLSHMYIIMTPSRQTLKLLKTKNSKNDPRSTWPVHGNITCNLSTWILKPQ